MYTVKETIESIGQDPYIAFKLDQLVKEQNLELVHFENKDVYLGKNLKKRKKTSMISVLI